MAEEKEQVSDLELIAELEKAVDQKLPRINFDNIIDIKPGYAVSEESGGRVRVRGISLARMKLKTIPPLLARFQGLESLQLLDNEISDLSPISGLSKLTFLCFFGNQVSDLSPISGLTNLMLLWFYSNQVSELSPISGLSKLTYLGFDHNDVSDLWPITGLYKLAQLSFDDNRVSDLSPISGLANLTKLSFRGNQVSDLSPISGLANLTKLWFRGNQVSDLSPISGLARLEKVDATNNRISTLPTAILNLKPELDVESDETWREDKIFLNGNPLEQPPPEIISRGKEAVRQYLLALE